jgi:amino-acid N-acetyltransferase
MSSAGNANAGFRLRSATQRDLDGARSLLLGAELPEAGLEEQFGDGYAIAEAHGEMIGLEGIEIHGEAGLLRSAVVSQSWRGRGVGDALTRDRIAWARRRGLEALYLLTTTAGEYFPRFGFVAASREDAPAGIRASREFGEACPSTALFMKLPLNRRSSE